MDLTDFKYRTFTYVAGDWTGDKVAIDKLYEWNDSKRWGLSFKNIHSKTQSKDTTLNCNIKASLRKRMRLCKMFVLIVGSQTDSLRSGACHTCQSYITIGPLSFCGRSVNNNVDNRSYIQYECEMAEYDYENGKMNIVVLYNSVNVNKSLCPEPLRSIGEHIAMKKRAVDFSGKNHIVWDYDSVRTALN